MASAVRLVGEKRLQRKIERLKGSAQRRIMRPAVSAGLTVVNRAAKRTAPRETGLLAKAIGKKVKITRSSVWGAVGPRLGFEDEDGRDPAKYGHLAEKLHGFLKAALHSSRRNALSAVTRKAKERLKREASRS